MFPAAKLSELLRKDPQILRKKTPQKHKQPSRGSHIALLESNGNRKQCAIESKKKYEHPKQMNISEKINKYEICTYIWCGPALNKQHRFSDFIVIYTKKMHQQAGISGIQDSRFKNFQDSSWIFLRCLEKVPKIFSQMVVKKW